MKTAKSKQCSIDQIVIGVRATLENGREGADIEVQYEGGTDEIVSEVPMGWREFKDNGTRTIIITVDGGAKDRDKRYPSVCSDITISAPAPIAGDKVKGE